MIQAAALPGASAPVRLQLITSAAWERAAVDTEAVDRLARSIRAAGGRVSQPVLVRPRGDAEYEVVCGIHRVAAARALGLESIDAWVVRLSDAGARLIALQDDAVYARSRPQLEVAWAAEEAMQAVGGAASQADVGDLIGLSESRMSEALTFAGLVPRDALRRESEALGVPMASAVRMSRGTLRALRGAPSEARRWDAIRCWLEAFGAEGAAAAGRAAAASLSGRVPAVKASLAADLSQASIRIRAHPADLSAEDREALLEVLAPLWAALSNGAAASPASGEVRGAKSRRRWGGWLRAAWLRLRQACLPGGAS